MADDELSEDQHRAVAKEMYERWQAGEAKSQLEIEYWQNATSHGKAFTAHVKKWLGVETERKSGQTEQIDRLEGLLRAHGVSPSEAGDLEEEWRLVAKARESALAALRVYNDPLAGFRTETFIVLMVIAWNSIFQAMLERDGTDYYQRNPEGGLVVVDDRPKVLDTAALMALAIGGTEKRAVRANLDFFVRLRNLISHRYIPALDIAIVSEAQAMLLNFENLLTDQFGAESALGDRLAVPLQLSGFRNADALRSLKQAQAQLPVDVTDFLCRHRDEQPDEVVRSSEYALQVFFVSVAANRDRSADAVVTFVRPGEVSAEVEEQLQQAAVVTKPKQVPVASGDLLRASEVVNLVTERLPFRFTMDTHTRCWRHYGVRPPSGAGEKEAVDGRYCSFDRLSGGYGYTRAWVEKLVRDLSSPDTYEEVVGVPPTPR